LRALPYNNKWRGIVFEIPILEIKGCSYSIEFYAGSFRVKALSGCFTETNRIRHSWVAKMILVFGLPHGGRFLVAIKEEVMRSKEIGKKPLKAEEDLLSTTRT
jgi:hypothetical protein